MKKLVLLAVVLFVASSMDLVFAQTTGTNSKSVKKEAHRRIVKLKDRIGNQRERIDQGLEANTLTADQAQASRDVLDKVVKQMKDERAANGSKKVMKKEQYDAYNTLLDANSNGINEEKQYFYYYGPYVDYGADYSYYYDPYTVEGAPTPSMTALEETHPRIFELKERIQGQRERIDKELTANTLTEDQAKGCRDVLASVENQIKMDYKANGSMKMTKEQYLAYNATLDVNSSIIHEGKQYYYYYGPYYDQYQYWD